MALIKLNPARDLLNVDRMLDDFFTPDVKLFEDISHVVPLVNVEETDEAFKVSAELPGMKKDDIKISFQENILTISGEKKAEKEHKEKNYHRVERSYGKFSRSIGIPSGVKLDEIDAEYKQGVLYVTIPKTEEAKPKKIEVKVK